MELSPKSVANTTFKTVKKGFDPAEVRLYLENLAKSIESLQSQATAMEARARAAVARLQEIAAQPAPAPAKPADAAVEESETISRTLLLAQRTADVTIAEATIEAKRIADTADEHSRELMSGAEEAAARLIEEAKIEARRAGEGQRFEIESEVQSLLARREFLISDVDHLELHIIGQRDRLREVANALTDIVNKVPGGLGDVRRPLVSAVGDVNDVVDVEAADSSESIEPTESSAMAYNEVPEPVIDALEASSAMSELDQPDREARGTSSAPPTIISDPSLDPIWSGGASVEVDDDPGDADHEPDQIGDDQTGTEDDESGTPPSGQPNQFLFEDITEEVPRIRPHPVAEVDSVDGDDPR